MSTEPPGRTEPEDDLDRAFGPDTASVQTRTTPQRVRRGALVAGGVVLAAGVLVAVLATIVGSVQDGVGGVFPRPDAAAARFDAAARALDGVHTVGDHRTTKTGFASYDVVSVVTAETDLGAEEQDDLVAALSAAAASGSGNGVRVFAVVTIETLRVGVSADAGVSGRRLALARQVATIGGVYGTRCGWESGAPTDEATAQVVTVVTGGRGNGLGAVLAKAEGYTQAVFPGARVTSEPPPG
ncbi:MAG: hypothetical protein V4737_16010 [Curtobacterium sp.]